MSGEKDPIIERLESQALEKDKYISSLEGKLNAAQWYKDAYKKSVLTIAENFKIPEPEPLVLPEEAPELFTGKQSESIAFLEKHYGKYLTYFGAKKDILFQYQLSTLDFKLASSARNSLNYQRRNLDKKIADAVRNNEDYEDLKNEIIPTYTEVVPPKSVEIDQLIETTPKKNQSIGIAIHGRAFRKKTNNNI